MNRRMIFFAGLGLALLPSGAALAAPPATAQAAPASRSAAAVVQQFLTTRAAGQYVQAYGLLSPGTRQMIPFDRFEAATGLPKDPGAEGMSPALAAVAALFLDAHNTLGYRFSVLDTPADAPSVVVVQAQPPGAASPLLLKIVVMPGPRGDTPRLDAMQSFTRTDAHAFDLAREKARQMVSLSNLRQIGLGILMYTQDHHDTLPDAARWVDEIMPYVKSEAIFQDPSAPAGKTWSYAYNTALSGVNLGAVPSPASTVIVFESTLGTRNAGDNGASAPRPGWHQNGIDYAFVDGHARWYPDTQKPSFRP